MVQPNGSRYDRMGSSFQMALFYGCPRDERKYYSWIKSTTATQRLVQPEARLNNSTLSPRASKPLLWWDRLPLNSPGQRKGTERHFTRARDASDFCSHSGPLKPRCIPTLRFLLILKGKRAFLPREKDFPSFLLSFLGLCGPQ